MNLVPSERAVLNIIRALMQESKSRSYLVTLLRSRWPVLHLQAYDVGYRGLIDKRLIELSADEKTFSLTSAGVACLGPRTAAA